MARTTASAVQALVNWNSDVSVEPFIETATALIDAVLLDAGYSDTLLELIERWLSAHFYSVRMQQRSSESVESASVSYQNKVDLKLMLTSYGQQVAMLDYKGILAALGKPKVRLGATYLGKTPCEKREELGDSDLLC